MKLRLIDLLTFSLCTTQMAQGYPTATPFSTQQRQSLKYHLEHLYNEADLLIRNQRTDEFDLLKLHRDLQTLKVFQRIPFEAQAQDLKKELKASASSHGVTLLELNWRKPRLSAKNQFLQMPASPVRFPLSPQEFTRTLPFNAQILGHRDNVLNWLSQIKTEQMRLIDWENSKIEENLSQLSHNRWLLKAHAFQFLPLKHWVLKPKSPQALLPEWARRNPHSFAVKEPSLWLLITRTEAQLARASSLYQKRGDFKLNEARLHFFLSKTLSHPSSEHSEAHSRR